MGAMMGSYPLCETNSQERLWVAALVQSSVTAYIYPSLTSGGYTVIRYGGGQAGILRTWGKYVASSAATFGYPVPHTSLIQILYEHWNSNQD